MIACGCGLHIIFMLSYVGIEYIEDSHQKRLNREKKMEVLRKEIAQLNKDICDFQQTLPASGAPITRQVCFIWDEISGRVLL